MTYFDNKKVFKILLLYRLLCSFLFIYLVPHFTPVLDSFSYMHIGYTGLSFGSILQVRFISHLVWVLFFHSDILTALVFSLLGSYAINMVLREVRLPRNYVGVSLLGLLFLPSFNLWTACASKEVLVLIFSCYLLGLFLRIEKGVVSQLNLKTMLVVMLCLLEMLIFKPLYIIIFFPLFLFYLRKVNLFLFKVLLVLLLLIAVVYAFYRIEFMFQSLNLTTIFQGLSGTFSGGGASRDVVFDTWYSYFYYGFLSYWGPSFSELHSAFQYFSFMESAFMYMLYFLIFAYFIQFKRKDWVAEPWGKKCLLVYSVVMIYVVQIPYGAFNAGAAIRYRCDIYMLAFFILILLLSVGRRSLVLNYVE